jgi:hypothetical protein
MSNHYDKGRGVNVQVLLRCRPLNEDELRANVPQVISCNEQRREVTVLQNVASKQVDQTSDTAQDSAVQNQIGWYDISLETDEMEKVKADPGQGASSLIPSNEFSELQTVVPCSPFMWFALSSTNIKQLGPQSSVTLPYLYLSLLQDVRGFIKRDKIEQVVQLSNGFHLQICIQF